jgi:hypothetical protein
VSAGDFVTTQYSAAPPTSAGVTFYEDPNQAYDTNGGVPHVDASTQAHSSPNVADIYSCPGGCGEFPYRPKTVGYLDPYANGVSVYVGYLNVNGFPNGDTAGVYLTAYDSGGNPVGSSASTISSASRRARPTSRPSPFTRLAVATPASRSRSTTWRSPGPRRLRRRTSRSARRFRASR